MNEQQQLLEQARLACKFNLEYLCHSILDYGYWDSIHSDLSKIINRPSKRKLILVPRGHSKTAVITKGWTIQQLLKNPNRRILIANQVWDKAREMLFEIKQYLEDKSQLPLLFGEFKSNKWNEDDIVIRQRTKALSAL